MWSMLLIVNVAWLLCTRKFTLIAAKRGRIWPKAIACTASHGQSLEWDPGAWPYNYRYSFRRVEPFAVVCIVDSFHRLILLARSNVPPIVISIVASIEMANVRYIDRNSRVIVVRKRRRRRVFVVDGQGYRYDGFVFRSNCHSEK